MKNLLIVNLLFFIIFCTTWESPYDPDNPDYVYPFFIVDSIASTFLDKDTIIDSIPQMVVFGNDVKSQFRWRLDSTSWCEWIEKGTKSFAISLGVVDTGWHTLGVQTCYNPNAHVADSTFKFYRACCPAITKLLLNHTEIVSIPSEIRHGSTCTLTVSGSGTGPISYKWYKDSTRIDSAGANEIFFSNFQPHDSGNYICIVSNKWCTTNSKTLVLNYLPPIQYAPEAQPDTYILNEDDSLIVTTANGLLKNDSDKNNDILTTVLSDSTRYGTIVLNTDGSFCYKPGHDFFGIDTFNYQAKDLKGFSTKTKVTITIRPINDPPIIAKNTGITVQEGGCISIASSKLAVTDIDDESSTITFILIGAPKHGELKKNSTTISDLGTFTQSDIDTNVISYQHDGSETIEDTMMFSISDSSGAHIDSVQVITGITPVNDAPYIQTKNSLSVVEGGVKAIGNMVLFIKDDDNPANEITFRIVELPVNGNLLKQGIELRVSETFTQEDLDNLRVIYQHTGGNTNKDSMSFTIADKKGATISETLFKINVGLTDDPPVAINDLNNSLDEDSSIIVTLVAEDPEEKPIVSYEIVSNPKHGTLTGTENKRAYTPSINFNGIDTFTFRATDGNNWSNVAIVVITIVPINDAPEWKRAIFELEVKEGVPTTVKLDTLLKGDPEGDSVIFSKTDGAGILSGNQWMWTPAYTAAASSPAQCEITATDNGNPKRSSTISFTITAIDSFCMLTTTVIKGSGTIQVQPDGANFDPGTDVQITAIPETGYVFKKWSGSVNDASKNNPTISVTMNGDKNVMASFTKKIETITLNNGESVIHGSLYVNGYFFLSTRTSPAKLLRFNADSISDYQEITFSSGHCYADQITYVASKNKLYVVFGASYRTAIAEVDPITMTYNENAIVDTFHGASPVLETNGGQSICNDGSFLYVVTARADTSRVLKYSLSTMSSTPVAVLNFPPENVFAHAIRHENGKLFISNGYGTPWVARVNASTLQIEELHSFLGMAFTDDFAISGNYLFLGIEADYSQQQSGKILRLDKTNFDAYYYFDTGKKGGVTSGDGSCYAVQEFDGSIWATFATNPGIVTRINPVSLEYQNYSLPYNSPNEILYDGERFLITYWKQDPGVVQAIHPSWFSGHEIE